MKAKSILAAAVAATAMLGASSCATMNQGRASQALATGLQALTLTNDQVQGYVHQAVQQMDAQNRVAPASSPYAQRLARLTSGLTSVGSTPLNFKVYLTDEVNAFACADGSVRVYSGIMDMMDDDELLGIIGHEVGHVGLEHSKNAFKQDLINSALLQAAGATSETVAALTDSQLGQLAAGMASAKFSRKQENEADEFGYEFLKYHNRNPYNMVEAFEKMQKMEGSSAASASYFQKMFSSHPETAERIAHIKQLCKRDGFTASPKTTTSTKAAAKPTSTKSTSAKTTSSAKKATSTKTSSTKTSSTTKSATTSKKK